MRPAASSPFTSGNRRRRKNIKQGAKDGTLRRPAEQSLSQPGFTLRRMTTGDLPDVLAIEAVSFPNPWSENTFLGEIQNVHISFPLVAVAEAPERIIGYVIYWQVHDEVQINNIAVHPEFRGLGVGESLLKIVLERLRAEGVRFVSLEVRVSNTPARSLYKKLGFETLGLRKGYYINPAEDALVMGLVLGE